ncbi:hypothetical protein Scep_028573 [Stephania cephalantha]|uniref:Uncharacterized protein n=1 Tax=Stephania cephalantha TaxID=152367 RepID=A0AAP0HM74_9MAGN
MSVVQFPDLVTVSDLQIWNNEAFDPKEGDDRGGQSKENVSPTLCRSPVCTKSPVSNKGLNTNGIVAKSQGKPLKILFKEGLLRGNVFVAENETARDERKIDAEIEEIEKEISRLSCKLEALRLEKAGLNSEAMEKPKGGAGAVKIGERKESAKDFVVPRSDNVSLRRGVSLGPSEIIGVLKLQKKVIQEMTPIQSTQSRRKSCLWKIGEIDERGSRRGSVTLSPKSRTNLPKFQASQRGFTTIGSKKFDKTDDRRLSSIQPKKLFNEGDKFASVKKPIRSGRVIASRYNQIPSQPARNLVQNDRRKTMAPETVRSETKKSEKTRSSSVGRSRVPSQELIRIQNNEVKKKLGNQGETTNHEKSITKIADLLPKIRTIRNTYESPRNSGAAKRVADLDGRKSYFGSADGEEDDSVCQVLCFDDDEV